MRYSFNFNILKNRFPFKWGGENINNFMKAIKDVKNDFVTALNSVYDTQCISHSSGEGLDWWGEVLGVSREPEEDDNTYQARLLVAFRDIQDSLTVEVLKNAIKATTNSEPSCREHYSEIPRFPFLWPAKLFSYAHLLKSSYILGNLNHIENGGFEDGTWGGSETQSSAQKYKGDYSAELISNGTVEVFSGKSNRINIDPTTYTYTVSAWVNIINYAQGKYVLRAIFYDSGDDRFDHPQGITSDDTYLYIADTNNHRIVKRLKSDLSYVTKIGSLGSGDDQFDQPRGITSDDIYLYITDINNHRIVKRLKSDLSYVAKIGSVGSGDDQFNQPRGITSDDTYLYISDTYNNRIVKRLKSDLSYVAKIGTAGSGDDQFLEPRGITCDDTYLYITDMNNNRIVKRLKSDLSYVAKIGSLGPGDNQFDHPQGITSDDTYLYIADTNNHRIVKRLKSNLSYVAKIGSLGPGDDQLGTLDWKEFTAVTTGWEKSTYTFDSGDFPVNTAKIDFQFAWILDGAIIPSGTAYIDNYKFEISDAATEDWTQTELNTMANDLQGVKLATLKIYLVEDSGLGYYVLKKQA